MKRHILPAALMLTAFLMPSCSWESTGGDTSASGKPILLQCGIEPATRHSLTGFVQGDEIGVYVVNNENGLTGILQQSGNQADNARYIYDSTRGVWEAADVCWKDLTTPADIYAYHPRGVPADVRAHAVSVATAQNRTSGASPAGLLESDMLWGHVSNVSPQAAPVPVQFVHLFSKIELHADASAIGDSVSISVSIPGLFTGASVDLSTGLVTLDTTVARQTIVMLNRNPDFEAIVIPQEIAASQVLFDICADGEHYICQRSVSFESGRVYRFEMALQSSSISLSLNQITDWVQDGGIIRDELVWSGDNTQQGGSATEWEGDRAVLMELYRRTGGDNWKNNENWGTSADLSTWKGVSVTEQGRVRILNLSGNQLSGQIPGCLGLLSELTSLQLYNNQLSGAIPDSLFMLEKLTTLGLYKNQLTGSISENIGHLTRLTTLNLYQNQLSGSPSAVTQLTTLNDLNIQDNAFSGNIPDDIGRLTRLRTLNLSKNQFSGNIPSGISELSHLTTLNLSENNLTGNLPAGIALIESLRTLIVNGNRLSGTISAAFTSHSSWSTWNAGTNITPQQEGYGLIVP